MLFKKNRYLNLKRVRSFRDVPAPKPNEVVVATREDRLLDSGMPELNRGNKVKWWADLPSSAGSYRRCYGINDLLNYGFTVSAWCDFEVLCSRDEVHIKPSERHFRIEHFEFSQVGECPITQDRDIKDLGFPKLVTPFYIRTAPGWSIMTFQHPLLYSRQFQVMPGMIHTDFYHELNVVLNISGSSNFVIEAGTPLLYCLPVNRKSIGVIDSVEHAGVDVAEVLVNHGLGYSGIERADSLRRGVYRQRLRQADE